MVCSVSRKVRAALLTFWANIWGTLTGSAEKLTINDLDRDTLASIFKFVEAKER
jgi:hypothetical protein